MYQNHYLPLQTIGRVNVPYVGGFCKWWYVPIEDIASFPAVNPATQQLISEPVLQAGKKWFGPVNVPDKQLGWEEDLQRAKPGIYYKEKVVGYLPGLSAVSHVNLQNLALHQVCIVGKLRCGFFIILGNTEAGLEMDTLDTSGTGSAEAPGTKLVFSGESKNKALILPSFALSNSSTTTSSTPLMETIFFTNQTEILIPYTSGRRANFGDFPLIEVWIDDGVTKSLITPDVQVDQQPPNQTQFTVKVPGPISGFIIIK